MNGRVVLVTGSTDGIGKATALELARKGAMVLLHGRNPEKGEAVLRDLCRITGSDCLHLYIADFSYLEQVRRLAAQIREEHDRLHLLINNAGTFEPERKMRHKNQAAPGRFWRKEGFSIPRWAGACGTRR